MSDPTRHPAGQQSRAKKSWKLSPFPLISHLWELVSSCFIYMCWSFLWDLCLCLEIVFLPKHNISIRSIHPIHHHPSSSMPSIHSLGFIHIDRCSATAQRDRGTLSCSSRCCSSSCLSTSRSSRRFFTWCGKIHVGIEWRTQRTREDVQQKLIELTKNINCSINGDIPEYNRINITRKMEAFYTNHR